MRRILFLGQKPLGEQCFFLLKEFASQGLGIVGVVSNSSVENVWWRSNAIYSYCQTNNVWFCSNERNRESEIEKIISKERVDMLISVQHNWVLSSRILELVNGEAYNLHNAPLPEYKGYNSFTHAILNGEKNYASTIHKMIAKVDTGDIVLQKHFAITPKETAASLFARAHENAISLFRDFIQLLLLNQTIASSKMCTKGCFYDKHAIEQHREVKNIFDKDEVDKKVRAFYFPPFEPAFFFQNGSKIYIVPHNPFQQKKQI